MKLVGYKRYDHQYRIVISDAGIGIPQNRQSELFLPFRRLDAENSDIEGTGIGLCITKELVEMMDGNIGFESQAGIGSSFWVDLPIAPSHESLEIVEAEKISEDETHEIDSLANIKRYTILYIEDNPANLRLVQQFLRFRKDIKLISTLTPKLGIELAMVHRPDLILLDINLPGMDGYQILEVFKASSLNIPVVAVTANAMNKDIERGKKAGFIEYLIKPLDITRFENTIAKVLSLENIR